MKPREWWVHVRGEIGNGIACSELRQAELERDDWNGGLIVHVREVIPGTVTISREKFLELIEDFVHGDDQHRQWLRKQMSAWFDSRALNPDDSFRNENQK